MREKYVLGMKVEAAMKEEVLELSEMIEMKRRMRDSWKETEPMFARKLAADVVHLQQARKALTKGLAEYRKHMKEVR